VKALNVDALLRGFAWARLGLAVLLLGLGPVMPPGLVPGEHPIVLAFALSVAAVSSGVLLLFGPVARPRPTAWLFGVLDIVLITAIVAATGGGRSIFSFLYVLSVTGACVLLSRTGGLVMAGVASLLYTGVVLARTVFPTNVFFDATEETTALELLSMFLNTGTFLIVAIVAGGLAERFRATSLELETQRKDLADLQAFKDLVFQSVGTGLIALDRDHQITAFNGAAEEITGRSARETIGRPWTAIFGDAVPLPEIEAVIGGNVRASTRHETLFRRPDGTAVPVRLTFSALRSGEGDRLGLIAACDDLSTIRAMEARMRQADRLATLGRMAANIAHEIRNPLASLTGAIEVLTRTGVAGDARERLSQIVVRESERLNQIITNFLEYTRPAPLTLEAVDIAEALEGVLVLLEHRGAPAGLKVVREFSSPLVWRADPQQFRQVLWNLCRNAVEAMPEGGELRVGAATVPGRKLEVWVADTGHGIAPENLAHVFEPFFSTKPGGTGLGLSLVHRIIQEHGGEVDVRSTPGLGTTFTVTLPTRDA
jgi:two-component system, NtrC family, sensor histidine kinase PilS